MIFELKSTWDLINEPSKNFNRKLDETHREIGKSSTTNTAWAKTTQYSPENPNDGADDG